jgi:bifunctional DNA-binding transcriptional regulator/antitoxin component of YhaV-PrlF toxin-antitoxin module
MKQFERIGGVFMRATGIVRRIDELGRVVIPKEIRRTLRIREGDPSHTTFTVLGTVEAICRLADRMKRE